MSVLSVRKRVRGLHDAVISRYSNIYEEAKVPWDPATDAWAAGGGHLHILEYLVERKYDQYDNYACFLAAEFGHLDCLKYLHKLAKAPWASDTASIAADNGHLHILEYLVERKYDQFDSMRVRVQPGTAS